MPELIDKFSVQIDKLNSRVGGVSSQLSLYSLRVLTGLLVGLTVALIGQEIIGYGKFSLTFVSMTIMGVFFRMSIGWGLTKVLVFDLICFLIALLLRMYIQTSLAT